MRRVLQANPSWNAAAGHPLALAQGLWTGAAAAAFVVVAGLGGDAGLILAAILTAIVPGALVPLAAGDILVRRQASDPRLTAALACGVAVIVLWAVFHWVLPAGLPVSAPWPSSDEAEFALPALLGLLFGAERMAAHGHLAWRDRALGAAAGYATVAGVFILGAEWLSWTVLLAALLLRLPTAARLAFAILAGAGALGLGQFIDGAGAARAVEITAFAIYAGASLLVQRHRPVLPPPVPPATAEAA